MRRRRWRYRLHSAAGCPGGRARKGWRSARRFDGISRRYLSGLTRAGRHCGVVAAPPDLCVGVCSRDGGRGAPSRGVRGAVPCDQIGRWRAARGDELRLMEPFTPPAPSRWSLCAEAGRLSPFGGPIDIWAKSVSRCRRLQARPADSRRTAAQGKPTLPSIPAPAGAAAQRIG